MFFQQLRDLCLVGENVSSSRPANIHLTPAFLELRVQARTDAPEPRHRGVKGQKQQLPLPTDSTSLLPQELLELKDASSQSSGSSGDSQLWVSHLQKGHREQQWEAGGFSAGKIGAQSPPLACSL